MPIAARVSSATVRAAGSSIRTASTAATMIACAATSMNAIRRLASMWNEKNPAEIPTAAFHASR